MAASSSEPQAYAGTLLVESTLESYKQAIAEFIVSQGTGLNAEGVVKILKPSSAKDNELTLPIPALSAMAKQQGSPQNLAAQWAQSWSAEATKGLITGVTSTGVFMMFGLDTKVLIEKVLLGVFMDKSNYGRTNEGQGQSVVVEYSSPNMAKPFHAGHLRSTIIGNFIRNLYDVLGYKTTAINYLGDWGKQYGLLAVGFSRHGDEAKLKEDPIRHLYDVYVKINADRSADTSIDEEARSYFARMEAGDEAALKLWQHFRDLSIEKSKQLYARMNINFDVYSGESFYPVSKQEKVIKRLEEMSLLTDEQTETGVVRVIDLSKYKLGRVVFQKPDGSLLYISRDIAAALDRAETYNFSKMVYVVASQQDLHFKQLFKILELMGFSQVKDCVHVNFGLVRGMSSRKGTAEFLEDILDTTRDTNLELMRKNDKKFSEIQEPVSTADTVGISAVVIQDLIAKRIKDYDFSYDRMLQSQGDTGAYLQFAHVRIASIMRKANVPVEYDGVDLSLLSEPECSSLVAHIANYSYILHRAEQELEPSTVVQYSLKLTHAMSSMIKNFHVKHAPTPEIAKARMLMFWAAKQTLENALRLLSLVPLERM